jgi:histidinol dehydrogenase
MKIISGAEFDAYWTDLSLQSGGESGAVDAIVNEIIAAVRDEGDWAIKRYAAKFDRSSPDRLEVPADVTAGAVEALKADNPELYTALEFAAGNIRRFAELQRAQFQDFETEITPGVFTGQRVIPVERAGVYVPGGRFPLISTVLMGLIPAIAAGAGEVLFASPPQEDGLPDRRILAAAGIALAAFDDKAGSESGGENGTKPGTPTLRVFSAGGAQAIAALALGTESIPRVDVIAGPGNKYVVAAKRLLAGEVGIDLLPGPTDVLIITGGGNVEVSPSRAADLAAADMLAQAEHDPDARARILVPDMKSVDLVLAALERRLASLPTAATAEASLDSGGLIIIYETKEEAIRIANIIAPEHLELQAPGAEDWLPLLKNYGSIFIGEGAAEVLGDYSAGINHTLPTSGSARFSGGLSVRHFLKTVTTLRCTAGAGHTEAVKAAESIAKAEGLAGHAASAAARLGR